MSPNLERALTPLAVYQRCVICQGFLNDHSIRQLRECEIRLDQFDEEKGILEMRDRLEQKLRLR